MPWKPEFMVYGEEGQWYNNGQTFATQPEAEASAYNRFCHWTMAKEYRAVEVDGGEYPVNYRWDEEKGDVRLEEK